MKNKKATQVIVIAVMVILLTSAITMVFIQFAGDKLLADDTDLNYFSAYTEIEEFQKVPAMQGKNIKVGKVMDYGSKNYMVDVSGSTYDEYLAYLKDLQSDGFKIHSDNGQDHMEGYVATTNLVKKNLVVTVMHLIKNEKTYISASYDLPLSDALTYVETTKDMKPGAKTKVHMVQLNNTGNSFVIQLKNGHFIVYDGGQEIDAPYLLDYLEKLAPQGEKPVIEAWFISHAHSDHYGAMAQISSDASAVSRVSVEGFYFHNPGIYSANVGVDGNIQKTILSTNFFRNQAGEKTPLFRPQFGQRYYFADIIIDVCLTPELFPLNSYYYATDINDTSIWLMAYIENQKFLVGGDAAHTSSRAAMSIFEEQYFDMDVFAVFHHGINVYDYFTNYITVDTVLYTSYRLGSIYKDPSITSARVEENALLQQKARESISHENGTVVLSFPYEVGQAEIAEPFNWKYNEGGKQIIVDFDSN